MARKPGGNVERARLDALIAAVTDGGDVDWIEAERSALDPAERQIVANLQVLAQVARAGQAVPAATPVEEPPPTWGRFEIRATIGTGTYGTVFRAWEPRLEREVALKLLSALETPEAEAALIHEARLLARVHHSNVVMVYDADKADGSVGLWMELVEGRTLKDIVTEQGPFSAQEAVLVGLDLCGALAAVHGARLIHRDIKAQNVMRAAGGRIVLMDFGAAAARNIGVDAVVGLRGSPAYVAPEVLEGGAPNEQTDLYSLGVLLYYLASGRFPVTADSIDGLRQAHAAGRRTPLRDVRPDLPSSFVRVVDDAIAALPQHRPGSAGAMETLLERALGWRSVRTVADRARSIAVLPFSDLTADHSLDFFCDGVAAEIANALTGVTGLHVVACNSKFRFDGSPEDVRRAARLLDVDTVLEGSVRAAGRRLRIISRLIDAGAGTQRWSQRFDSDLDDVFAVQDEIANAVVRALGVVAGGQAAAPAAAVSPSTRNVEAYTLYLKGRHAWNQRSEAALHKSVELFQAAVARDPGYAEAYAALAEAHATLGLYGVLPPEKTMPVAREMAGRAIALLDTLPSPSATIGCIAAVYEWDWAEAGRHFTRAIELNPAHPAAHHWYAINYLVPLGRLAEADTELRRAIHADPLAMPIRASVGLRSYFARRYDDAARELRETFDLDAASVPAHLFLGLTLVEMGQIADALGELEAAARFSRSPEVIAALAYASARGQHADRARALLAELLALSSQRYVSPSLVAQIHSGLGEVALAFDWLERAAEARAADLAWLAVRPVFDAIRSDARFAALRTRVGV